MSASVLTQVASCALMCVLGAALAFASKKSSSNGSDLNYASIVLISEIVKFLVACSLFVFDTRSSSSSLCAALFRRPFVTSALPSMFFAFQNNVAHLAHRSTNPITFQLIMNSRSFAVAVLQAALFQRRMRFEQILPLSIITSCISLYIVQIHSNVSSHAVSDSSISGLLMSLLVVLISAASTLANERLYSSSSHPSSPSAGATHAANARIYACGSLVNAVILATSVASGQPALGSWSHWAAAALALQVLYGLCVAHVIKHMGALFRSAVSCYQVLAAAVIAHLAGEQVSWLQLILMMGILVPATSQLARTNDAVAAPPLSTAAVYSLQNHAAPQNCSSAASDSKSKEVKCN